MICIIKTQFSNLASLNQELIEGAMYTQQIHREVKLFFNEW